ncbi:thiamine diphosphokinase [Pelagivirga sediminicola]|nr:thiamine diphosphokinase [Pelagivirga sediminicola]
MALIGGAPVACAALDEVLSLSQDVVAADGGAATAAARGLALSAVIGDLDSITEDARAAYDDILHHVAEQDSTDFEKCLVRMDAPLIIGAGFSGGRLDHQLAVCNGLVRHPSRRCILIGEEDIVFLAPPALALDLEAGTRVSLFPMGAVEGRSEGLNWPIGGLVLTPDGQIGTSNFATGPVQLSVTAPKLLVILPSAYLRAAASLLMTAPARWP